MMWRQLVRYSYRLPDLGVSRQRVTCRPSRLLLLLLILAAMCLSGCSLFTVNLKGPRQSPCYLAGTPVAPKDRNGSPTPAASIACSTDDALRYAAGWRKTFMDAAGQHSAARSSNAIVAFPASAIAAFYGVSGHGSKDRISRLSIGAAGYYGATSFLAPIGKQRAYLEGALALSCAIDAGINLRHGSDGLTALESAIKEVIAAQTALRNERSQRGGVLAPDSATLARAAVIDKDATNLLDEAAVLLRTHRNLGLDLASAVDEIVIKTAQLVTDQETGLQSLLTMTGGLRQTATSFGLSALPPKVVAPQNAGGKAGMVHKQSSAQQIRNDADQAIEKAIDKLRSALDALMSQMRRMALPANHDRAYALCAPEAASASFAVTPAESAQSIKIGESIAFRITNTQSNAYPTWQTSGGNRSAVEVDGPKVSDGQLTIEVKGKTATGAEPVALAITDPTGSTVKRYTIAVLPDTPPAGAEPPPKTRNSLQTAPAGFAAALTEDDVKRLQCHLGLTGPQADGRLGDTTYSALVRFAGQNGIALGPQLTHAVLDQVLAKGQDHCAGATP